MSFYIEKIIVTGSGKTDSIIEYYGYFYTTCPD